MFNVWPVEISYTRIAREGVLAGIPCKCTLGVEDEEAGKAAYEALIVANPDITFSDLKITKKR